MKKEENGESFDKQEEKEEEDMIGETQRREGDKTIAKEEEEE